MAANLGFQELLYGTLACAAIVLCGAGYALGYALARLRGSFRLALAAALSYLLLALAAVVLVDALALDGFWLLVTGVMLAGYLLLPHAVWHLCVGTHADGHADFEASDNHSARRRPNDYVQVTP